MAQNNMSPEAQKRRQQRHAQRKEDYRNQDAPTAGDFNFNQHNRKGSSGTHVSGQEARHVRETYGRKAAYNELQKQKDSGAEFGARAQKKYDTLKQTYENVPDGLDPDIAEQALRGKGWGAEDQARYDQLIKKRGEAKGQAQQYINNRPQNQSAPTTKPADGPYQANDTAIANTQTQTVTQDNDQQSSVVGDNNYVYQNQDNSVRNYGGDNRSFVYNSQGEGPDTPATMATLAGFYAPDDSPAAQAKRLDMHVTMNRDNQKAYANTSHIAEGAIARADRNSYIDPAALDKRIAERSEYHRSKATLKGNQIFGDLFGMSGPTWNSATPADPVEKPDFDEMYDKYTDF